LTYKVDLDRVKMNYYVKYLGQKSNAAWRSGNGVGRINEVILRRPG